VSMFMNDGNQLRPPCELPIILPTVGSSAFVVAPIDVSNSLPADPTCADSFST